MIMADNVPQTTDSAPSPAPSTGSAMPSGGYTSSSDMFADMEKLLGLDDSIPSAPDARPGRDIKTEEDFLGLGDEEEEIALSDDTSADDTEEAGPVEESRPDPKAVDKNAFPTHKFSQEIGGQKYDFDIKSPEQLNTIVSKAIVADQVYAKYRKQSAEIETLKGDKATLDNIDKMLEENPHQLLNNLTEDLDDDVVRQWIMQKAEEINQDPGQRAIQKKLKYAEVLEQKMAAMTAREEALEANRRQAAMDADKHTVGSWMDGQRSLMGAKVPEKYMGLVEDQLKYVIMEARDKTRRKEQVTIKTLDTMLNLKMKPILDLIAQDKPSRNVDREVGQALQSKKEQNLSRIQSSTSSRQPGNTRTNMQKVAAKRDGIRKT
jgi:hypothetical protein